MPDDSVHVHQPRAWLRCSPPPSLPRWEEEYLVPPDYALKNDKPGVQCFTTDVGLLELVHIWGNTCAEHGRSGLRIFFHRTFAGVPLPDTDPNESCLIVPREIVRQH